MIVHKVRSYHFGKLTKLIEGKVWSDPPAKSTNLPCIYPMSYMSEILHEVSEYIGYERNAKHPKTYGGKYRSESNTHHPPPPPTHTHTHTTHPHPTPNPTLPTPHPHPHSHTSHPHSHPPPTPPDQTHKDNFRPDAEKEINFPQSNTYFFVYNNRLFSCIKLQTKFISY